MRYLLSLLLLLLLLPVGVALLGELGLVAALEDARCDEEDGAEDQGVCDVLIERCGGVGEREELVDAVSEDEKDRADRVHG